MRLTGLMLMALALCASVASAQYTGPWTYQWDFNTSTQGWTVAGNGYWTDPGWVPSAGPTLPDGAPSGGGNGNFHLPDGSYARLDVRSLNLGAGTVGGVPMNPFVYQVDVYIPNLRPLGGFPFDYPGNMNHQAGIQVLRESDLKALFLEGDVYKGGLLARDQTWENTDRRSNWVMEETVSPDTLWWDKWITLQLDYGVTTPGKWRAWAYIPWNSYVSSAGWQQVGGGSWDVNPSVWFGYLQMGGQYSWTQAQFDNARLYVQSPAPIPEPVFFQMGALMGMGALGMLKLRRRA
ncbi:MAG: hypothetical protein KatS3mg024_2514 [Armatimonadota bacterium]|nr:MAG: hypothetical protein KatS3mg024_2514 [Armatimonadota bacterium]